MLRSRHHFFIYPFFQHYTRWLLKRHFHQVTVEGTFADRGFPVLLIGNHIGWWDGFWAMYLKLEVVKRKIHFMMQEDQLLRFRFFNYTGAFSVKRNSREALYSLRYASSLLQDKGNMVLIYPQGRLQSLYCKSFHFEKGIERILQGREGMVQLLMSVNMIDYLAHPKPSLTIYLHDYEGQFRREALEEAYNRFYSDCLTLQTSRTE
ncbi:MULTISPECIES: lysophospholipid acyltransferase family protein [unclassified Proteiniphilum]|jgi:1-acyl-sn-glycerol-3-phosphate acyltransferase|uniref:lysophospholipid acyltransferase family protein n=1 Tax=unclassified Proteiniphilum TaxID=2622718 RepID=UPI00257C4767|nr:MULTISPECIES: lysophospholipid acyltransferase family protein [unclassified Proteiniphilum]